MVIIFEEKEDIVGRDKKLLRNELLIDSLDMLIRETSKRENPVSEIYIATAYQPYHSIDAFPSRKSMKCGWNQL